MNVLPIALGVLAAYVAFSGFMTVAVHYVMGTESWGESARYSFGAFGLVLVLIAALIGAGSLIALGAQ